MRGLIVLCLLLVGSAAGADEAKPPRAADGEVLPALPPRSPPDETPTQYACTTEKLLQAQRCTWEFEPKRGEASTAIAQENSKKAAAFARACPAAATGPDATKPDAATQQTCEADIARLSIERCGLEGRVPFEDVQGKLAVAARPCVEALLRVIARTTTATSGGDLHVQPAGPDAPDASPAPTPHTKTKAKSKQPAPLKI